VRYNFHRWKYRVIDKATGQSLGFLAASFNALGLYGASSSGGVAPLNVTFRSSPCDFASQQQDLFAFNAPNDNYRNVVAISSTETNVNLATGSPNYLYIGGGAHTDPGSTPQALADNSYTFTTSLPASWESAIWTYSRINNELTAQWVNDNGSLPTTILARLNDALVLIGDITAFEAVLGPVQLLQLFFVPTPV